MTHRTLKYLLAAGLAVAAVPALAQSNSANEGAAATPDGTYAKPVTPPPVQDQDQAQRQANSDPYNMPQNRDAYSAKAPDPSAAESDEATGNGQARTDADSTTPSEQPASPPSR
ncbi:MAG TPA: hypothetical protein VN723_11460 [Rhizomicrobium sp.]|nr:hypothetical protein [Rhizomicrobium sp.]